MHSVRSTLIRAKCLSFDSTSVHGSIAKRDCVVAYRVGGKVRAAASIYRDRESLAIEEALSQDDQTAIEGILAAV